MPPTVADITVLLVDDHALVRQGLARVLARADGIAVVGEAADGRSAVAEARRLRPQVVVMDIGLPALNGIDATRAVLTAVDTAVLMLSMHGDDVYVRESLRAGAKGYVLKDAADAELIAAVHAVARGQPSFSPAIAALLVEGCLRGPLVTPLEDAVWTLSGREREIVQLVAEGRSKREIARLLGVRPETVERHRKRVMEKLGLHSVAEIVRFALRSGILR
jgi:two-component system response regulator NreC